LDGPLVGVEQAWYDEGVHHVKGHKTPKIDFKVHIPYDGQIFKVPNFHVNLPSYML